MDMSETIDETPREGLTAGARRALEWHAEAQDAEADRWACSPPERCDPIISDCLARAHRAAAASIRALLAAPVPRQPAGPAGDRVDRLLAAAEARVAEARRLAFEEAARLARGHAGNATLDTTGVERTTLLRFAGLLEDIAVPTPALPAATLAPSPTPPAAPPDRETEDAAWCRRNLCVEWTDEQGRTHVHVMSQKELIQFALRQRADHEAEKRALREQLEAADRRYESVLETGGDTIRRIELALATVTRERDEARAQSAAECYEVGRLRAVLQGVEARVAEARRLAFKEAHRLLLERADTFDLQSLYGTGSEPSTEESRSAAASRSSEWHEAARQVANLASASATPAGPAATPALSEAYENAQTIAARQQGTLTVEQLTAPSHTPGGAWRPAREVPTRQRIARLADEILAQPRWRDLLSFVRSEVCEVLVGLQDAIEAERRGEP